MPDAHLIYKALLALASRQATTGQQAEFCRALAWEIGDLLRKDNARPTTRSGEDWDHRTAGRASYFG